jgi:hypothetical protein
MQTVYKNSEGIEIIMTYNRSEKSIMLIGNFEYNITQDMYVAKDANDRVIMIDIFGGPCLYAPALWGVGDEKESSTDLGKIDEIFQGLFIKKIVINDVTNAIKLIVKKDETDITAKLRIKEYRTEESTPSMAV